MARNDKGEVRRPNKERGNAAIVPLESLLDPVGLRRGWDLQHRTLVAVTGCRDL